MSTIDTDSQAAQRLQHCMLARATTSIVRCKGADAMAALFSDSQGRPCAAVWVGPRTLKPVWRYRFITPEGRAKRIAAAFEGARASASARAARKPAGRLLQVGDILRASWGYEQTNIDYYEVTALIGATMVEVRKVAQQSIETGSMVGKCVPAPGEYIGPAKRYKAQGDHIRIASYAAAYRLTPTVVAGAKVYSADSWTAYA